MQRKWILGNWKMHGNAAQAQTLAAAIAKYRAPRSASVVLFPPATLLPVVKEAIVRSSVELGGQDCSIEREGAFTGDISAAMLKDAGGNYVIVGHSERRTNHQESNETVKRKALAALEAGLTPVICVGEKLEARENGSFLKEITIQIQSSVPELTHSERFIIAYEPIWAIGSGRTPTTAEIAQVHKTIASLLSYATSGARTAIVYGGSVKASNAKEILAAEGVDGVLIGGASLKADEFCAIISAAE